jgi:hypothetical protein
VPLMGQRPLRLLPLEVERQVWLAAREDEPIVLDRSVRLFLVERSVVVAERSGEVTIVFVVAHAKVIGSAVVVQADLCKIGDGRN